MTSIFNYPALLFLVVFAVLVLMVEVGFHLRNAYTQDKQDILHEQVKEARDGIVFLLADYAAIRLAYLKAGNDAKSIEKALAQTNQLLGQSWYVTQELARTTPTPITSIFIQSLNVTTDISEKQIATLENRISQSVWLMILIIAALACLASGMAVRRRMLISMLMVPLMAAVVTSLTAELDSPRSGVIRVGVGSMERVQATLHSALTATRDR